MDNNKIAALIKSDYLNDYHRIYQNHKVAMDDSINLPKAEISKQESVLKPADLKPEAPTSEELVDSENKQSNKPSPLEQDSRDGYLEPVIEKHIITSNLEINSAKQSDPQIESITQDNSQNPEFIPDPVNNNEILNLGSFELDEPRDQNPGSGPDPGPEPNLIDLSVFSGMWTIFLDYQDQEVLELNPNNKLSDFTISRPDNKLDSKQPPQFFEFSISINDLVFSESNNGQGFLGWNTVTVFQSIGRKSVPIERGYSIFYDLDVTVPELNEGQLDLFSISMSLAFTQIENLKIYIQPPDTNTKYLLYDPLNLPIDALAFDGTYTFSIDGQQVFSVSNNVVDPGVYQGNLSDVIDYLTPDPETQNGDDGELQSLNALNIKEILLISDDVQEIINDSTIFGTTQFTKTDGTVQKAFDVGPSYIEHTSSLDNDLIAVSAANE